jgi:hypothetical protein
MAPRFSFFPAEIIAAISDQLQSSDLCALRLVCREVNEKTLYSFCTTCFTTLRTDLSLASLQILKEISGHQVIRHHVQRLVIEGNGKWGRGFNWYRHPSGCLVAPLLGHELLRGILVNNLVNCRSFRFNRGTQLEAFYKFNVLTGSDSIAIILSIIIQNSLPVKSFCIDFRKGLSADSIDGKRLEGVLYRSPGFTNAWTHLQELCLDQRMLSGTFDLMLELVLHATNLRRLSLKLDHDHPTSYAGRGVLNNESISFINRISSADSLFRLEDLSISHMTLTEECLSKLLCRFCDSLRILSFSWVRLKGGGTWASLIRGIRSQLPLLESISVSFLRQQRFDGVMCGYILYTALGEDPVVPSTNGLSFDLLHHRFQRYDEIMGTRYKGPNIEAALEILAESAVLWQRRLAVTQE